MSPGHLRAKEVKSRKNASIEKPNDFHLNTFQWKFRGRNFRKCATNASSNCAFATEKAKRKSWQGWHAVGAVGQEVEKPISRNYNYVYESTNLTATAAKRQEVVKWPVRIPCTHPTQREREKLSVEGLHEMSMFWRALARLRAKLNEVKTLAQIITHLSLRYRLNRHRLDLTEEFVPDYGRPYTALAANCPTSGAISYFGIKSKCQRLDLPSNPATLHTPPS